MRDNVRILESARCFDGSVPTLVFYENGECIGSPYLETRELEDLTDCCVWSEEMPVPSYCWSLMYRCNHDPDWLPPAVAAFPTKVNRTKDNNQVPASVCFYIGNMFT